MTMIRAIHVFAYSLGAFLILAGAPRWTQAADTEAVTVSSGKAGFNALLQSWFFYDTTQPVAKSNFRLRRAEIKFSGSAIPGTRWFVMIDAAKSLKAGAVVSSNDNSILQDLGLAYSITPELEFVAGQFKIQTTAEGLDPSAELIFPERSITSRDFGLGTSFGDRREPGAMLTYKADLWKLSAMASNGGGTNVSDVTNPKDLSVRLEVNPIHNLKLGAFTSLGDFNYATKGAWGANARYTWEDLLLRAEVVKQQVLAASGTGWVAEAAYMLNLELQPAVRYESISLAAGTASVATAGINYYLAKHASKIQASYSYLNNVTTANGSPGVKIGQDNGSLVTLAFSAGI